MTKHARMQIHTRMNWAVDWEVEILKKKAGKRGWWKDCKRQRQGKKHCAQLYLSLGPSVEFRTVCSESFLWVMTHHRAGAHTRTHACIHTNEHPGRAGSETAWEHPGNRTLCQTQHTRTHAYAQTHAELSLCGRRAVLRWHQRWQEGILPGFCFSILRKGTQTQAGERRPNSTATETRGYLLAKGHIDGTHSLG